MLLLVLVLLMYYITAYISSVYGTTVLKMSGVNSKTRINNLT